MNVIHSHSEPFVKIFFACVFALVTTFLLFTFMHKLVLTEFELPEELEAIPFPDVSYSLRKIMTVRDKPLVRPENPPAPPELLDIPEPNPNDVKLSLTTPNISPTDGLDLSLLTSSSFPVAKILSTPIYPRRASQREIEGYVDVYFDVTKFGATENIQVQAAEPPGYFEESAIKAVKRWRFQPVVKNGEPVAFQGMVRRVTYQMQK